MQFLTTVKTILALLPLLIQAIQTIESLVPSSSTGAVKLEAVKGIVQSSYNAATDVTSKFEEIWPAISGTVSSLVALFNATGIFKK